MHLVYVYELESLLYEIRTLKDSGPDADYGKRALEQMHLVDGTMKELRDARISANDFVSLPSIRLLLLRYQQLGNVLLTNPNRPRFTIVNKMAVAFIKLYSVLYYYADYETVTRDYRVDSYPVPMQQPSIQVDPRLEAPRWYLNSLYDPRTLFHKPTQTYTEYTDFVKTGDDYVAQEYVYSMDSNVDRDINYLQSLVLDRALATYTI